MRSAAVNSDGRRPPMLADVRMVAFGWAVVEVEAGVPTRVRLFHDLKRGITGRLPGPFPQSAHREAALSGELLASSN